MQQSRLIPIDTLGVGKGRIRPSVLRSPSRRDDTLMLLALPVIVLGVGTKKNGSAMAELRSNATGHHKCFEYRKGKRRRSLNIVRQSTDVDDMQIERSGARKERSSKKVGECYHSIWRFDEKLSKVFKGRRPTATYSLHSIL